VHTNIKVPGEKKKVLISNLIGIGITRNAMRELVLRNLWTDVLTEEVQRRELELAINLLNIWPNQPPNLWRFVYSYLNMTKPAMERHISRKKEGGTQLILINIIFSYLSSFIRI